MKKGKAMDLAKNLRDKERFNAKVSIVDQGKETDDFWSVFPDKPGPTDKLPGKKESGDDEEAEKSYNKYIVLYKYTNQHQQHHIHTLQHIGSTTLRAQRTWTSSVLEKRVERL